MWFKSFDKSVTNAHDALERLEGTEGAAAITIADDSLGQCWSDPWQSLDGRGVGNVEIDERATRITFRR